MQYIKGYPESTQSIIHALRVIASSRSYGPKQRSVLMTAADRLEELEERIAIMEEGNGMHYTEQDFSFPGGEDNEKH